MGHRTSYILGRRTLVSGSIRLNFISNSLTSGPRTNTFLTNRLNKNIPFVDWVSYFIFLFTTSYRWRIPAWYLDLSSEPYMLFLLLLSRLGTSGIPFLSRRDHWTSIDPSLGSLVGLLSGLLNLLLSFPFWVGSRFGISFLRSWKVYPRFHRDSKQQHHYLLY